MSTSGIDVSQWQGVIDWTKVKPNVDFALIRAGYGDTLSYPKQVDKQYARNYSECKRLGIHVGVYFYSYATTTAQAEREADACIALLKGKQFEFPIYYDVEEMSIFKSGKTNEIIKAFCDKLEKAGYWVGIYIYRAAAQKYLNDYTRSRYAMAIAEYSSQLHYSGQYGIWQNSSSYAVSGIGGRVDHDFCYVNYPKLIKEKGKNGYKATKNYRVAAKVPTDLLFSKDGKPPVDVQYPTGQQCTIEYTVKVGSETWGKVKGRDSWANMADFKRV